MSEAHSPARGGALCSWRLLFSSILSTNWLKSILNTSKQRILRMKAAFAARVNLVTQVAEAANFSCWWKKLGIGTVAHKKIASLQCFERCQSAPNKVIRENSCAYFLFFSIYFLFSRGSAWITTCIFFETIYLIWVTLQKVQAVRSVASSSKFYRLPSDKENTGLICMQSACPVWHSFSLGGLFLAGVQSVLSCEYYSMFCFHSLSDDLFSAVISYFR